MGKPNQFRASEFIENIPGTGGVISTIAKRVGCDWHTAKKYIEAHPTIKQAYEDECETVKDLAESVLIRNIQLAHKQQQDRQDTVDTSDVKWYLSRKGKDRGYTERSEQEISGTGGGPIVVKGYSQVSPDDWDE